MGEKPDSEAKPGTEIAPSKVDALAKRQEPQEPGAVKQLVTAFKDATAGHFDMRTKEIQGREKLAKIRVDAQENLAKLGEKRAVRETVILALVVVLGFVFLVLIREREDLLRDVIKIGGGLVGGGLAGYGYGVTRPRRRR